MTVCVCCLSSESLKRLFDPEVEDQNVEENYAKMLSSCLNIEVSETQEGFKFICEKCTFKLKDWVSFKEQALASMDVLRYSFNLMTEPEVQIELPHDEIPTKGHDGPKEKEEISCLDVKIPVKPKKRSKSKRTIRKKVSKEKVGRNHEDSMPYEIGKDERKCRECQKEFQNLMTLKIHYNTHFRNHVCEICNKGFVTRAGLTKHATTHRRQPVACCYCEKVFYNVNTLRSHKRYTHNIEKPFRCKVCNEGFQTLQQNLNHAAEVHGLTEKPYQCPHCPAKFKSSGDRCKHVASSHNVVMLPCTICGQQFRRPYMPKHMFIVHGKGTGLRCAVCDKAQPTKSALVYHVEAHFKEKRYTCKLCGAGYTQKGSLTYHIQAHMMNNEFDGDPKSLIYVKEDLEQHDDEFLGLLRSTSDTESTIAASSVALSQNSFEPSLDWSCLNSSEKIYEPLLDEDAYSLPSDLEV